MKRLWLISGQCGRCCILILLVMTGSDETANAQRQPRAAFRDRVVDLIILDDGTRLYGTPAATIPDGFVFRTEWLKSEAAEFFARDVQPNLRNEGTERRAAEVRERLRQEVQRLQQAEPPDLRRIGLIMEVLDRQQTAGNAANELIVVVFPRPMIRRHQPQSVRNRQLGLLAFLNRLDEPETSSWQKVARQLNDIDPTMLRTSMQNPQEETPDFQFQRIMAAIDYRTRTCLSFISTGNRLIPDNAEVQIPTLMAEMLGDSIRKQIELLTSEEPASTFQSPDRRDAALIQLVEQAGISALTKGVRTISVSEYDIAPEMNAAVVRQSLFTVDALGKWYIVNRAAAAASITEITPAQTESVSSDPQVRQITELFGSLLPAAGTADANPIDQAVRLGTVVQLAGKRSGSRFEEQLSGILNADLSTTGLNYVPVIRINQQLRQPPVPQ